MSTYGSPNQAPDSGAAPYGLPEKTAGPAPGDPANVGAPPELTPPGANQPGPRPPTDGSAHPPSAESVKGLITEAQPVRADLLPQSFRARIALAGARRTTVVVIAAAIGVVILGFVLASLQVSSATTARNAAQAEKANAEQAVAALAEVPRVTNLVNEVSAGLELALSNEVLFSGLTTQTASALPAGTVLESMSWTLVEPTAALAGEADEPPDLGDLALNGQVCQFVGGASLLDSLQQVTGLQNVWLSSQSFTDLGPAGSPCANQPQYAFTVNADLSEDALSNRYAAETPDGGNQP